MMQTSTTNTKNTDLQSRDQEVGSLAHRFWENPSQSIVHDSPLASIHCQSEVNKSEQGEDRIPSESSTVEGNERPHESSCS
jgi:hypothetical protein